MPARFYFVRLAILLCVFLTAFSAAPRSAIQYHDLGFPAGTEGALVRAINNRGEVVGEAYLPVGSIVVSVPFLWRPKRGFELILADTPGGSVDINDRGEVVGTFLSGEEAHGFLWDPRSGLADLGANLRPVAINNRGQVAGECVVAGVGRACLWEEGVLVLLEIPFGDLSFVADINSRGQVNGFSCAETCTDQLARLGRRRGPAALRAG
jgi:probable HAF family extracellular repeat protein